MEPGTGKNREHREITYQVGWKKGRIEWNEGAAETLSPQAHSPESSKEAAARKLLQLLWLPAMKLPGGLLLPLLYTLPVLCFTLTLVLIIGLRQG